MTSPKAARLPWPDFARGISVVLVVLHHVTRQMVDQAPITWQPAAAAWTLVDGFLTPIRIPLFFFISGLLVARALERRFWAGRRAWSVPAYLYILWSVLLTLRLLLPGGDGEHSFAANLIGNLVLAGSGYWYLYALPLYFIYAYLTRHLPGWIAALPLLIGLFTRGLVTEWTQSLGYTVIDSASLLGSVAANGIFFWLGARYGRRVAAYLTSRRGRFGIAAAAAYVLVQLGAMASGTEWMVSPLTSALGIALGVILTSHTPEHSRISRGVRFIGKRTLPVYVAQFFFISALSFVWTRVADLAITTDLALASWLYPIVVTAAAVGLSLLGYRLAKRTVLLRWLFVPPTFVTGKRRDRPDADLGRRSEVS